METKETKNFVRGERLKYSLGIVLAIICFVFWAYTSLVGFVYSGMNLRVAGFIVVASAIVIFILLFYMIKFKAEERASHYKQYLCMVGLIIFPIIFSVRGYFHFWSIASNGGMIESVFNQTRNNVDLLFTHYEQNANLRLQNYKKVIERNYSVRDSQIQMDILKLKLLSENYQFIKNDKNQFVEQLINPSIWNPSILGDLGVLDTQVKKWKDALTSMYQGQMPDESNIPAFRPNVDLSQLNSLYTETSVSLPGLILLLVVIGFLILPYFLQPRPSTEIKNDPCQIDPYTIKL